MVLSTGEDKKDWFSVMVDKRIFLSTGEDKREWISELVKSRENGSPNM